MINLLDKTNPDSATTPPTTLCLFLTVRTKKGTWHNHVCHNLDEVIQKWTMQLQHEINVGVLHVGFEAIPTSHLDTVADQYSQRLLITAAAKHIVPSSLFTIGDKPVAWIDDLALYLELRDWGYVQRYTAERKSLRAQAWVAEYIKKYPNDVMDLAEHRINNDATYLEYEQLLEQSLRHRLGVFRTHSLLGTNCIDPCKLARVAPPWFANKNLIHFRFPIRVNRLFIIYNLNTVADLAAYSMEKLCQEPTIGYKTMYGMSAILFGALKDKATLTLPCDSKHQRNGEPTTEASYSDFQRLANTIRFGSQCDNPCILARVALPWLATYRLSRIALPNNAHDALAQSDIRTVADLATHTLDRLRKVGNLNRSSLRCLVDGLNTALTRVPIQNTKSFPNIPLELHSKNNPTFNTNFSHNLKQFVSTINFYERYVFEHRLGYKLAPFSQEEIAYCRNISTKATYITAKRLIKKLKKLSFWSTFVEKFTYFIDFLKKTDYPLKVSAIDTIDPWFLGVSGQPKFFITLAHVIDKDNVHLITINNTLYFAAIKQIDWKHIVLKTRRLLFSEAENERSEAEVRALVHRSLPDNVKAFKQLLWEQVAPSCHFITAPDGKRILISYGDGVVHKIKKILAESDTPLHRDKIIELASAQHTRKMSITTLHCEIYEVGLLFGDNMYGALKHIPLSNEQLQKITTKIAQILRAQKTKKHWFTTEILSELSRHLEQEEYKKLDLYLLDIIIARSNALIRLKKRRWIVNDAIYS